MSKHFRVAEVLGPGARVAVDGHRFVRVLRARVGSTFTVCDGAGALWQAEVKALEPFMLEVVAPAQAPDRNPHAELEVWLPLLKGGRSDDLVRQLTELGVTRIVPFVSRYAVVKLEPSKVQDRRERMQAIAREAGNQCGRTMLPEVALPVSGLPPAAEVRSAFLWEGGGEPAAQVLAGGVGRILIGPEGGLSAEEAALLVARGFIATTLGARILRAETAVVTFAALSLAALGEL